MSFLAPLYAAGLLAISLPIIFHLIRRTPRGRVAFSSLMFLSPSPPRVTRRSRLENLWLLLLRGLAVCLLALAFTRPFFRDAPTAAAVSQTAGEQVVILIDTSASMRRADLWERAAEQAVAEVDRLAAGDRAALFTFDAHLNPVVTFSEWDSLAVGERGPFVRERLQEISPSWQATHLDTALTAAVESLQRVDADGTDDDAARKRIVLIGDLQRGSRSRGLREFAWPEEIRLSIEALRPASPTNAGLQIVAAADQRHGESAETIRARVYNAADSTRDRFELAWAEEDGSGDTNRRQEIYVPAGQSRIVQAPLPPQASRQMCLKLFGDDHPFDNAAYYIVPQPEVVRVWSLGAADADDPQQARYYLKRALPDTPARRVEMITPAAGEVAEQAGEISLAVLTEEHPTSEIGRLQQFLTDGGTMLYMLPSAEAVDTVAELIGSGKIAAEEAATEGYAMLGDVQFDHPLFASFSEARYSDFTKIHFWRHRRIDESALPDARVLARFDDGSAALVEIPVGAGRLLLLTTGWNPADSQLALSSKFAPLLNAILEQSSRTTVPQTHYHVGETVSRPGDESGDIVLVSLREDPGKRGSQTFTETNVAQVPGIYQLAQNESERRFAVNLHPDESRTEVLPTEQWEQWGIPLRRTQSAVERAHHQQLQRQLQNRELESRQKLWQWLILAAAMVLIGETWLAGRTAR